MRWENENIEYLNAILTEGNSIEQYCTFLLVELLSATCQMLGRYTSRDLGDAIPFITSMSWSRLWSPYSTHRRIHIRDFESVYCRDREHVEELRKV